MRAADIGALKSVSRPTAHPDGTRVVVSVTRPDLDADATVGQLFTVPVDGSGSRRITRGFRDTAPAFSPDGLALAFLRAAPGAPAQLYVMDARGGEAIQLTEQKLGVADIRWSPDSQTITYTARVAEAGRYGTVEGLTPSAEPARRITTVKYKSNGLGYTNDRRTQVFTVARPALGGEPHYPAAPRADGPQLASAVPESVQLTEGEFDHSSLRYLDDRIAVISARHESRDRDLHNQIWVLDADGSATALLPPVLSVETFDAAPDGTVYFLAQDVGTDGVDFVARNTALYRLEGETPVRLTDPESIDLGDVGTYLTIDGDRVLVQDRTRGTRQLLSIAADGAIERLSSGAVEIEGQVRAGDRLIVTFTSPETFGDVAELVGGGFTPLTDFSVALRATGITDPTELTATTRDGHEVHGWVLEPETAGPHPTLLMIHGGPFSTYTVSVFDEAQVYADAGYAVVFCNPRGSAGYGQAHGRAIKDDMGRLDMADVLDFLEAALTAHPDLDADRLGILGGSYGGYLTAWIIAHDHRFRAAIVERGYLDPEAFVGSSDIGWFFPQQYNGTDHEAVRAQSPQAVANHVSTPTLVIHSEDDLRCPIGQAETYYATLKQNRVDAEFLVFPGENHELSRSGRPKHRLQRFDAIVNWMGRYV